MKHQYKPKKIELQKDAEIFLSNLSEDNRRIALVALGDAEKQGHSKYVKKLRGEIWEVVAQSITHWIRFLFFWHSAEDRTRLICTDGFLKKTNTTPQGEIENAEEKRKTFVAANPPYKESVKKSKSEKKREKSEKKKDKKKKKKK